MVGVPQRSNVQCMSNHVPCIEVEYACVLSRNNEKGYVQKGGKEVGGKENERGRERKEGVKKEQERVGEGTEGGVGGKEGGND